MPTHPGIGLNLGGGVCPGTAVTLKAAVLGEAKVSELDVEGIALPDQDVARFEIAVCDRLGSAVEVYQSRQTLTEDLHALGKRETASVIFVPEAPELHVLHVQARLWRDIPVT
jgi:hypothetical protein